LATLWPNNAVLRRQLPACSRVRALLALPMRSGKPRQVDHVNKVRWQSAGGTRRSARRAAALCGQCSSHGRPHRRACGQRLCSGSITRRGCPCGNSRLGCPTACSRQERPRGAGRCRPSGSASPGSAGPARHESHEDTDEHCAAHSGGGECTRADVYRHAPPLLCQGTGSNVVIEKYVPA